MLTNFTINEASLKEFGRRWRSAKEAHIKDALGAIKREWQAEFVRQHNRLQKTWTPLEKKYASRKLYQFRKGKIPHNTILKRTGTMMAGYINGIRIDDVNYNVSIPFPSGRGKRSGKIIVRARSHQGVIPLPPGVKDTRKFELDKFAVIARREIRRALAKN